MTTSKKYLIRDIIIIFILCMVMIMLCSCSRTDKKESPNLSNTNASKQGESSTTASEEVTNGVIVTESISLHFGENSISDGKAVLSTESAISEKDNALLTDLYLLELEAECAKPVTMTFTIPENLSSESVLMLGIGMDYVHESGESERIYNYVKTTISDGKVTASLIPKDYADYALCLGASEGAAIGTSDLGKMKLYLGLFTQNGAYYENGHFELYYPAGLDFPEATRKTVLDDLEVMYNFFDEKDINARRKSR